MHYASCYIAKYTLKAKKKKKIEEINADVLHL